MSDETPPETRRPSGKELKRALTEKKREGLLVLGKTPVTSESDALHVIGAMHWVETKPTGDRPERGMSAIPVHGFEGARQFLTASGDLDARGYEPPVEGGTQRVTFKGDTNMKYLESKGITPKQEVPHLDLADRGPVDGFRAY